MRVHDLLPAEGEELAGEAGGALRGLQDLLELAPLGLARVAHQELGVPQDDAQRVVEVVGDAAGQASDRLHLLGLQELRLQKLRLADVADGGQYPAVGHHRGQDVGVELGPVLAPELPLVAVFDPLVDFRQGRVHARGLLRGEDVRGHHPDELVAGVSEHGQDSGVDVDVPAFGVGDKDPVRRALEEIPMAPLALAQGSLRPLHLGDALAQAGLTVVQRLLGLLASGDVDHDPDELLGAPSLDDHPDEIPQPYRPAVGRHHPVLQGMGLHAPRVFQAGRHRAFPVVGMYVRLPELGLRPPLAGRVTQEPLGLLAHVQEPEGDGIRPPQDRSGGVQDVALLLHPVAPPSLPRALPFGRVADHSRRHGALFPTLVRALGVSVWQITMRDLGPDLESDAEVRISRRSPRGPRRRRNFSGRCLGPMQGTCRKGAVGAG